MINILFVCHGNICRSPMAEFVMKDIVKKRGLSAQFHIESAATSREEIGNPVYPPVRRLLNEKGVAFDTGKTARQVTAGDYERFDCIVCMDGNNLRNIARIIPSDPQKKISRLMDFTGRPRDVADPWYTGDFLKTWQDVTSGCEALLKAVTEK